VIEVFTRSAKRAGYGGKLPETSVGN